MVTVFSSKFTIFYVQLARNYGYLCGILTMFFHCSTIVALEGEIFGLHAKYSLSDLVCCFLRGSYRLSVHFQRGQALLINCSF